MTQESEQQRLKNIFQDAQNNYSKIKKVYEESGYEKKYPLGGHWLLNLKGLIDVIQGEEDPVKNVNTIQETVMYSINTGDQEIKMRMIDWYIDYFKSNGYELNDLPEAVQESSYSNPNNSFQYQGRLISPDFLRTVIICLQMQKYCQFPSERFNVLELGAGYGGLARTFKSFFPNTCTVITDIPETLYFSYVFSRLSFPDAKICYVTDTSMIDESWQEYDYVFVPTMFAELLRGKKFEMFYNTASLGEMKNSVVRYWMDFVQNKIEVKYFFGLNRYLNTIDPEADQWRLDENCCSVCFDDRWKILQWELDPVFTRCPYFETLVSRNLEVVAERLPAGAINGVSNKERSDELVEGIALQDWFTRPKVVDTRIQRGSQMWPLRHTRGDNDLTPDLTMQGTLFALWEAIRLNTNSKNVAMMIQYLEYLSGKWPFEETFFYRDLLKTLTDENAFNEATESVNKSFGLKNIIRQITTPRMRRVLKKIYYGG